MIGELAITVNSLFQFQPYEHLGADQLEAVLTAEMAPMFELSNPPPDGNGMVRMSEMLGLILDEYRSFNESTHISRQIETIFLFLTGGLNFESLLDLTFIFHSFYAGRGEGILFGDETIFFNTENPENIVGGGYLNVLLRQFAAPVETYPKMLLSPDAGPRYFLDMTAFRRRPILRISPSRYVCIDPIFLTEKLSSGLYWSIVNALSEDGEKRTYDFTALWGDLFERYTIAALRRVCAEDGGLLLPTPKYEHPGEEAFDALITYGELVVLVQIKGHFVKGDSKYSGDASIFAHGLDERFGFQTGAALEQHKRNIQHTFRLERELRRRIPGFDPRGPKTLLPIVVSQESALRFGLATRALCLRFMVEIKEILLMLDVKVRPPIFVSIEDLETIVPLVSPRGPRFAELLLNKLREDRGGFSSFGETTADTHIGTGAGPNGDLKRRFEIMSEASLSRFASGVYRAEPPNQLLDLKETS